MIRAIRPNAAAQDDASLISGWNLAPNIAYTITLVPGAVSCAVLLYDEDGDTLIASGAALAGTEQPCILRPQTGQTVSMVDDALGWHLLITTTGTESQRTVRIGPMVDLPDEIHPIFGGDDDMALTRATAAIDEGAHYRDDVTVTCPLGLGAGLGDVVSVPVDGSAVVGQVESITWTATPDGTSEQAVIRRHVAIAPEAFVEPIPPTPPTLAADTATTDADTEASGNVLDNDDTGLTVVAVNGLSGNVGSAVAGSAGGLFTISSAGSWTFDPNSDFGDIEEDTDTSVTYYASDGEAEASTTLTVTVSPAAGGAWTPAEITTALWLDASDLSTLTLDGTAVSQWADKSGHARHMGQGSSSLRPVTGASINGVNAIQFDGSNDFMATLTPSTLLANAAKSVFAVFQGRGVGSYDFAIATRVNYVVNNDTVGSFYVFDARTIYNHTARGDSIKTDALTRGTAYACGVTVGANGSTPAHYQDGHTLSLSTSNLQPAINESANGYLVIGRQSTAYAGGKVGEVVCVSGVVDTSTRQKIEGYLAHKWGLAGSLPSDHPYKNDAPTI